MLTFRYLDLDFSEKFSVNDSDEARTRREISSIVNMRITIIDVAYFC